MRPWSAVKYLILFMFISGFSKAGNNDNGKEPNLFGAAHPCESLTIFKGHNSESTSWNKQYKSISIFKKKRGRKTRGIYPPVPCICSQSCAKSSVYSELESYYVDVNFISFHWYTRFNRGPPVA